MLRFRRRLQVFRSKQHLLHQQLIDYDFLKFNITVVNFWLYISCLNEFHSQPRSHGIFILFSFLSLSLSSAGNEVDSQLFSVTRCIATMVSWTFFIHFALDNSVPLNLNVNILFTTLHHWRLRVAIDLQPSKERDYCTCIGHITVFSIHLNTVKSWTNLILILEQLHRGLKKQ